MSMELTDDQASDLLRGLTTAPPRPPVVDLGRAIREGRRRRAARRAATAGAIALAFLAVAAVPVALAAARPDARPAVPADPPVWAPSPGASARAVPTAGAPQSCTVELLPVVVSAMDPAGRLLFAVSDGTPALWRNGRAEPLDVGDLAARITAANSSGLAVAAGRNAGAVVVHGAGKAALLPGGEGVLPIAVNEAGTIVGNRHTQPLIWRDAGAPPEPLPLPAGAWGGTAHAIDEDGTVVGSVFLGDATHPRERAYVWAPDGTGGILPGGAKSVAFAVRSGWALGLADDHAWRWDLRTGAAQRVPAALDGGSPPVNAAGWVPVFTGDHAELLIGPRRIALPDLPGRAAAAPIAISDDGRTILAVRGDVSALWHCA